MRSSLPIAALVVALPLLCSPSSGHGLHHFLFGPSHVGRCACDPGCACEPACACVYEVGCAVEPACAFEPACACAAPCGIDGRQFAGQKWVGGPAYGPPLCGCVGPDGGCCHTCGCGPTCGCFEPACGFEPHCGCGPKRGGFFSRIRSAIGAICGPFGAGGGCKGCSSELYWCEWYNDPPLCCDPCDCHGNWIGPSYGGYRAPYAHPHMPPAHPRMPPAEYFEPEVEVEARRRTTPGAVSRIGAPAAPQAARKPYPPAHRTYRR